MFDHLSKTRFFSLWIFKSPLKQKGRTTQTIRFLLFAAFFWTSTRACIMYVQIVNYLADIVWYIEKFGSFLIWILWYINVLFPSNHGWVLSPPLLAQDAFIKTCRRKVQRISEDDLYTEGEFMSEQDMIDENYKESLVICTSYIQMGSLLGSGFGASQTSCRRMFLGTWVRKRTCFTRYLEQCSLSLSLSLSLSFPLYLFI